MSGNAGVCITHWATILPAWHWAAVSAKRITDRILGNELAPSVFDGTAFPTMPLYTGRPWFIGAAMRYFAWRDASLAKRWEKAAQEAA